jgi:ATP-dependent protease ClpP protease subunit
MPRNRRLIPQAVLTPVLAVLRARDETRPPGAPDRTPQVFLSSKNGKDDGNPAVLRLYDAIGGWFGITASDVAELLDDVRDDRDLVVRINSPGGDVFDGTAIYNLLATHGGQVDVIVDGLAASAASFIAQAGDTITMNRGTQMMIHDAHGFTIGNAADHRTTADLLDGVSDEIAGIYAARAGLTKAEWRDRMREDNGNGKWYNAEAAVEAGLADKTADSDDDEGEEPQKAAASWQQRATTQPVRIAATSELAAKVVEETPELVDDQVEVPDEVFASLAEWLNEVFDPTAGYDPQVLAATIQDVYANAPAPPAPPPAPEAPQSVVSIAELAEAIMEGACP